MKQIKILGVLAIALTLGLAACNGGGDDGGKSQDTQTSHKHSWGEWTVTKPATCTEDGEQERSCACGEKQTKTIKAAHTWGEWQTVVAATCQAEGSAKRVCSVCNAEETKTLDKTDHSWGEWEVVTAADCENAGSQKHVCSVCNEEETETIQALGHEFTKDADGNDIVTWTKEATCTEGGVGTKHCTRCNQDIEYKVDALGHDIQLVDGEITPVEGKAAVRLYKCTRCETTYMGFKADEPSTESKSHLVIGEDGGARFWGRPIGNALALTADGTSVNQQNGEVVYCSTETGDFFEYKFDLTAAQAAELQNCRLYCDAKPADYLNGTDFWAYGASNDEWTPGYYIDGAEGHYEVDEDNQPVMVNDHARSVRAEDGSEAAGEELTTQVKMGKRIEDYRYILYVDGQVKDFDPEIKAPTHGNNTNMRREEFVLPYTFKLHEGENVISLRMAGGYRSTFYNFTFRPYEEPAPQPEPENPWIEDTVTVMPTPATDGALVKRYIQEGKDDVKYEIAVATSNISSADSDAWKTNPSTGAFKLNNGKTATFKFDLPKAFEGKMYQTCYMDSYNSNKSKLMFYQTNNHCNIEVKVNDNAIDFSQFATTTFQQVFGDETDGSNSLTKDVELGDVALLESNVISYKRVETLNTIVKGFVFIGKDHNHNFVAGEKAADSALRSLSCTCGQGGYELQAADLTSGHKTPSSSDKNTRLGKVEMKDIWDVTGIAAGTYNLYLQAQNSQYNDNAYWNAGTAQDNGDSASNNGNSRDFRYYAYTAEDAKVAIGSADNADLDQFSDFGLSYAGGPTWTNKPVAQITIAEGATSFTIENMNNGYSIWIYGVRLIRA